jgi:hypothetical protein
MPVRHARAAISTLLRTVSLRWTFPPAASRARARYRRACGVGERRGHDLSVPEAPMTIIGLGSPCRSAARASSGGWTDGSRLACSGAPATAQQPCPPSTGARLILVILPPCRSERHPTLPPCALRATSARPRWGRVCRSRSCWQSTPARAWQSEQARDDLLHRHLPLVQVAGVCRLLERIHGAGRLVLAEDRAAPTAGAQRLHTPLVHLPRADAVFTGHRDRPSIWR